MRRAPTLTEMGMFALQCNRSRKIRSVSTCSSAYRKVSAAACCSAIRSWGITPSKSHICLSSAAFPNRFSPQTPHTHPSFRARAQHWGDAVPHHQHSSTPAGHPLDKGWLWGAGWGERAQWALRGCKEQRCSSCIFWGGGLAFRRGAECGSNLTSVPFLHQGYGKSRSLSSIDGVAGPAGGLAPLASRYSSPCSPVPSIL